MLLLHPGERFEELPEVRVRRLARAAFVEGLTAQLDLALTAVASGNVASTVFRAPSTYSRPRSYEIGFRIDF